MPFKALIVLLPLCLLFAGCESGLNNGANTAFSRHTSHSANSLVLRGALQSARVTVSVLGTDRIEQIAAARTDANGQFQLDLPPVNRPLLVEVKAAADGSSRMICSDPQGCGETDYGDAMPLPPSFHMVALVSPDDLKDAVSINPWTHMAVDQSLRQPGLVDATSIRNARHVIAAVHRLRPDFWREDGRPAHVAMSSHRSGIHLIGAAVDSGVSGKGPASRLAVSGNSAAKAKQVADRDAGAANGLLLF